VGVPRHTGKQAVLRGTGPQRAISAPMPVAPSSTTLSGATGQRSKVDGAESTDAHEVPRRGAGRFVAIGGVALLLAGAAVFLALRKPAQVARPNPPVKPPVVEKPIAVVTPPAVKPVPEESGGVLVETDPAGAQVLLGSRLLGVTPLRVKLPGGEGTVKVHLSGFRDERVEISSSIDHVFERLRRASPQEPPAARPPAVPPRGGPPAGPPPRKKPRIGLDD
jgi:hypothetical protein